jgi:hypothetical protein
MEVDAAFGGDDLKAVGDDKNGCRLIVWSLRQACRADLAAQRTLQFLIPFVGHVEKSQTRSIVSNQPLAFSKPGIRVETGQRQPAKRHVFPAT